MSELGNVVRHVILRIVVDQSTLAAELQKARQALKDHAKSEQEANRERVKDYDKVTSAIDRNSEAIDENADANEALERSRSKGAKAAEEAHRQRTKNIQDETEATRRQIREEAEAESIRAKSNQSTLDSIQKRTDRRLENLDKEAKREEELSSAERSNDILIDSLKTRLATEQRQRDEADAKRAAVEHDKEIARLNAEIAKTEKLNEATRNARLAGQTQRANSRNESQSRQDATDSRADAARTTQAAKDQASLFDQQQTNSKRQAELDDKFQAAKTARERKDLNDLAREKQQLAAARNNTSTSSIRKDTADIARDTAVARRSITEEQNRVVEKYAEPRAELQQQKLEESITSEVQKRELIEERITSLRYSNERSALRSEQAANRAGLRDERGFKGLAYTGTSLASGFRQNFASRDESTEVQTSRISNAFRSLGEDVSKTGNSSNVVKRFYDELRKVPGSREIESMGRFRSALNGVRRAVDDLPRSGGGGPISRLGSNLLDNLDGISDGITNRVSKLGRVFGGFRGIILLVGVAFGPLAAILGSVGAAALGLASNLGALSGALLALPGLITSAVAGFGALALVIKPLSGVFSAFSAAQKEAATATASGVTAAQSAALAYQQAAFAQAQAQTAATRAVQDAPRALEALTEARRDATRKIEDYRTALKRLKYDEEGAELGVESSSLAYRTALADPTKTNLDRRIAQHDYQGSLNDQEDQQTSEKRLKEDSKTAFQKGIEGSDEVITATRNYQDALSNVTGTELALKAAIEATKKAQTQQATGGGTAAAELKAKLAELPPKTRDVVQSILDLNGAFKDMRKRLSELVFGPVSKDTGKFKDALKELESFLSPAAAAIGTLLDNAVKLLTNPEWKKFFATEGKEAGTTIGKLGQALLDAADGFRGIITSSKDFTDFVVNGIGKGAATFKNFANSTDKDGKSPITKFLEITKKRIQEFVPIIKDFADGIGGFFTALNTPNKGEKKDFTTKINDGILGIAENFKKLGEQAAKPNSGFRKWLDEVGPLLKDVVGFLGSAGSFFGKLFADKDNVEEAKKILGVLSDKILPYLVTTFDNLSKSGVISKIFSGIGDAIDGINNFLKGGGTTALSVFATIVENIGTTIDFLSKTLGGSFATGLGVVATLIASIAGGALFLKFTGLLTLGKTLGGVFRALLDPLGAVDKLFDKVLGKAPGQSHAERDARNDQKKIAAGTEPKDRTNTGGVLPTMYRMETLLKGILAAVERGGGTGGGRNGKGDPPTQPTKPQGPGGRLADNNAAKSGVTGLPQVTSDSDVRSTIPNATRSTNINGLPQVTSDSDVRSTQRNPNAVNSGVTGLPQVTSDTDVRSSRPNAVRNGVTGLPEVDSDGGAQSLNRTPSRTRPKRRPGKSSSASSILSNIPNPLDYFFGDLINGDTGDTGGSRSGAPSVASNVGPGKPGTPGYSTFETQLQANARDDAAKATTSKKSGGFTNPLSYFFGDLLPGGTAADSSSRRSKSTTAANEELIQSVFGPPDMDTGGKKKKGGFFSNLASGAKNLASGARERYNANPDGGYLDLGELSNTLSPKKKSGVAGAFSSDAEEYAEGYEDGLKARKKAKRSPGGADDESSSSRRSKSTTADDDDDRTSKRRRGRGARGGAAAAATAAAGSEGDSLVSDILGNLDIGGDDDDDDEKSRKRRGIPEEGGRVSRRAKLSGLFKEGGKLGKFGKVGGLAKGLGGGLLGAAVSVGADFVGGAAIDKFVKNDADKGSLSRGLGAVTQGAGIGATIGSIIPGVGTVVGGAVGGVIGGAYSLFKDKNLRNFVGGKISGAASATGQAIGGAASAVGDAAVDATKAVGNFFKGGYDGFKKYVGGPIANFVTKDIPGYFHDAVDGLKGIGKDILNLLTLPIRIEIKAIGILFGKIIPDAFSGASKLIDKYIFTPIGDFVGKTVTLFTDTIPKWFSGAIKSFEDGVITPIVDWIADKLPGTWGDSIKSWFSSAINFFNTEVLDPIVSIIGKIPGVIKELFTHPVDFFKNGLTGVIDAIKSLFGIPTGMHSGGEVAGTYSGRVDQVRAVLTEGEFVVRRNKAQQPGAKAFLNDFNEGRVNPADFYAGLSAATAPAVMTLVPPTNALSPSAAAAVTNVRGGFQMGDVTIHNPVREKAERSLRRALHKTVHLERG